MIDEDLLARMNDSQNRDRVLDDFNQSTLDDVGPIGVDQGMAVLKPTNDLGQREEQMIRESFPKVTLH